MSEHASEETIEKIQKLLRERKKTVKEIAAACSVTDVTVYRRRRMLIDAGELEEGDTVAPDKRVARPQPAEVAVETTGGEEERLTSRILDLNELVVDLVMENMRLKRALEDARAAG